METSRISSTEDASASNPARCAVHLGAQPEARARRILGALTAECGQAPARDVLYATHGHAGQVHPAAAVRPATNLLEAGVAQHSGFMCLDSGHHSILRQGRAILPGVQSLDIVVKSVRPPPA